MDKLPSIVFITTDTQGQNMVSAYGARGEVNTPNLDRLAAQGVLLRMPSAQVLSARRPVALGTRVSTPIAMGRGPTIKPCTVVCPCWPTV